MILTFGSVDLFGGNPTRDGGLTQNTVVSWEAQLPLLDKIRSELTKVFFFSGIPSELLPRLEP